MQDTMIIGRNNALLCYHISTGVWLSPISFGYDTYTVQLLYCKPVWNVSFVYDSDVYLCIQCDNVVNLFPVHYYDRHRWHIAYLTIHGRLFFRSWIKCLFLYNKLERLCLLWSIAVLTCIVERQHEHTLFTSSSSSRFHLVVGSLRQTQFSSGQFCHGLSFRWLSCLGWHSPSIFASVFFAFFSRVVPSPESFFLRRLGLASLRGQTTWVALSCTSLWYSLPSVYPWCFR